MVASPGIEPGSGASETLILSIVLRGLINADYFINPCAFVANIFTAMAIKITPKNFLTAMSPAGPKIRSINLNDFNTIYTMIRLNRMAIRIVVSV